ncbi:MAG: ribosome assembly cofactor RimP [Muribaculaceae bacterium]|nr:ribosome assembly cofactor RimP [Muribaculaceae bacterium]
MIDKIKLQNFIESQLSDTDCYLTNLKITPDNEITVEIDSDTAVDLDFCISLNHAIEEAFPTDEENYELEVGSAGLTSPLRIPRQYQKYIGKEMEIYAADGKKYSGILSAADNEKATLTVSRKVRHEGEKRPVTEEVEISFPYPDIRKALYILNF